MENQNNKQIEIELKENIAQGIYSNLAIITHSSSEFVTDFIQIMPGMPKAQVQSRIIMTPENAKRLMLALQENINQFENQFGRIRMEENTPPVPPLIGKSGMA
ncbi:MAG: DUF3467 domain-containing protein [Bacteroidales bacterium]